LETKSRTVILQLLFFGGMLVVLILNLSVRLRFSWAIMWQLLEVMWSRQAKNPQKFVTAFFCNLPLKHSQSELPELMLGFAYTDRFQISQLAGF